MSWIFLKSHIWFLILSFENKYAFMKYYLPNVYVSLNVWMYLLRFSYKNFILLFLYQLPYFKNQRFWRSRGCRLWCGVAWGVISRGHIVVLGICYRLMYYLFHLLFLSFIVILFWTLLDDCNIILHLDLFDLW